MVDERFGWTALADRAVGKPAQVGNAVVHDDCAGHSDVDAEPRRDLHDIITARQ